MVFKSKGSKPKKCDRAEQNGMEWLCLCKSLIKKIYMI